MLKMIFNTLLFASLLFLFTSCQSGKPTKDIPAVTNFKLENYLGQWYEIARLPHSFERNIDYVTATYTIRKGRVIVINQGRKEGKEVSVQGYARLKDNPHIGELEVSFFRPFYGDYRIIELAPDYSHAVITSSTKNYFWILARTSKMSPELQQQLIAKAKAWGFNIEKLEFPKQK
ncbi:MAG: lipocalin family protein [Lentisphaeria bacterium]